MTKVIIAAIALLVSILGWFNPDLLFGTTFWWEFIGLPVISTPLVGISLIIGLFITVQYLKWVALGISTVALYCSTALPLSDWILNILIVPDAKTFQKVAELVPASFNQAVATGEFVDPVQSIMWLTLFLSSLLGLGIAALTRHYTNEGNEKWTFFWGVLFLLLSLGYPIGAPMAIALGSGLIPVVANFVHDQAFAVLGQDLYDPKVIKTLYSLVYSMFLVFSEREITSILKREYKVNVPWYLSMLSFVGLGFGTMIVDLVLQDILLGGTFSPDGAQDKVEFYTVAIGMGFLILALSYMVGSAFKLVFGKETGKERYFALTGTVFLILFILGLVLGGRPSWRFITGVLAGDYLIHILTLVILLLLVALVLSARYMLASGTVQTNTDEAHAFLMKLLVSLATSIFICAGIIGYLQAVSQQVSGTSTTVSGLYTYVSPEGPRAISQNMKEAQTLRGGGYRAYAPNYLPFALCAEIDGKSIADNLKWGAIYEATGLSGQYGPNDTVVNSPETVSLLQAYGLCGSWINIPTSNNRLNYSYSEAIKKEVRAGRNPYPSGKWLNGNTLASYPKGSLPGMDGNKIIPYTTNAVFAFQLLLLLSYTLGIILADEVADWAAMLIPPIKGLIPRESRDYTRQLFEQRVKTMSGIFITIGIIGWVVFGDHLTSLITTVDYVNPVGLGQFIECKYGQYSPQMYPNGSDIGTLSPTGINLGRSAANAVTGTIQNPATAPRQLQNFVQDGVNSVQDNLGVCRADGSYPVSTVTRWVKGMLVEVVNEENLSYTPVITSDMVVRLMTSPKLVPVMGTLFLPEAVKWGIWYFFLMVGSGLLMYWLAISRAGLLERLSR